eukprot:scaffold53059_cov33-Phaeocystis_antarctica.AAC.1
MTSVPDECASSPPSVAIASAWAPPCRFRVAAGAAGATAVSTAVAAAIIVVIIVVAVAIVAAAAVVAKLVALLVVAPVAVVPVPPPPLRAAPFAPLVAARLTRRQPLLLGGKLAASRRVGARRH